MAITAATTDRTALVVALGIVFVFAVAGLLDLRDAGYSGLTTAASGEVTAIADDSPAQRAGFEVGDVVLEVEGVPNGDTEARLRQTPPEVGAPRTYLVERAGLHEPLSLELTVGALPTANRLALLGGAVIGVVFLLCGVGSYLGRPSSATGLLAVLGIGAGLSLIPAPVFSHPELRLLVGLVVFIGFCLMPATLLHFMLRFPAPRALGERPLGWALIYGPVLLMAATVAVTFWIEPAALPVARIVAPAVPLLLVLGALGVLVHRYVTSSRAERAAHGLNILLAGLAVAIVPPIVGGFAGSLPGASYYFLSLVVLPIALALAVRRESRAGQLHPQPA